jgi:hypothetical protein
MMRRIGPEEYDELCRRVEAAVRDATPADSVIAVVGKGDPRLVEIEGRRGSHFPGDSEGRYLGYHPRTSEEAIAQVEDARRAGAEFLCFPATATWWLDHYQGLAAWLGAHCRVAARAAETCVLYDLLRVPGEATVETASGTGQKLQTLLDSLLPEDAVVYSFRANAAGLSSGRRTVTPIEGHNAFGLRHRLEAERERPVFVLVAESDSAPILEPELEDVIASLTEPVARRDGLCVLFAVKAGEDRSRIPHSSQIEDAFPGSSPALSGEAVEKLSRRLQRLGLPGQDGASPIRPSEVGE